MKDRRNIVLRALEGPVRQPLNNAGFEGSIVIDRLENGWYRLQRSNWRMGQHD